MKEQEFKDLLPDYALHRLSATEKVAFEEYLINHPEAITLVDQWRDMHALLDTTIPEPSEAMDTGFYEALHATIEHKGQPSISIIDHIKSILGIGNWQHTTMRLALGICVLLIGLFLGNKLATNTSGAIENDTTLDKTVSLEDETNDLRSQLVVALADQPSATKRLKAVSEVNKMDTATDQVIIALFKMLNSDPNVNVRLAAVASLSKYVDNPKVREGLVMSITKQESPLVQIALADLMVTLKEQKSIDSMETLLQQPDINDAVKAKLEESIKRII